MMNFNKPNHETSWWLWNGIELERVRLNTAAHKQMIKNINAPSRQQVKKGEMEHEGFVESMAYEIDG